MEKEDRPQNWIVPGDWLLREGPSLDEMKAKEYSSGDNPFAAMFGAKQREEEMKAFTDHAVFCMDVTRSHVTIYDPLAGRPYIIQLDHFPGNWRLATEEQVKVTWNLAKTFRGNNGNHQMIDLERKEFPFRKRRPL